MINIEDIEFHTMQEARFIAVLPKGFSPSTITLNDGNLFVSEIERITGIDGIIVRKKVVELYGQLPVKSLI